MCRHIKFCANKNVLQKTEAPCSAIHIKFKNKDHSECIFTMSTARCYHITQLQSNNETNHTQILRAKPPYKTDSKHAMLSIVLSSEISSIKHLVKVRVDSFQATLQKCFYTHTHTHTHTHRKSDPAIQLGHVRLM